MRNTIAVLLLLCLAFTAHAKNLTIPAAASLITPPFYSDVRVFNASHSDTATVTVTYRCFIGACPSTAPQTFTIAPRAQKQLDDVIVSLFAAPNTAGAIELTSSGDISATSRLYSTSPLRTVGQYVPALDDGASAANQVVGQLANSSDARSNVGAFNPTDASQNVRFELRDGDGHLLGTADRTLAPHAGVQLNAIFTVVGTSSTITTNAYCVVRGTDRLFAYASVLDNFTNDPIFVAGRADQTPAGITGTWTGTSTAGVAITLTLSQDGTTVRGTSLVTNDELRAEGPISGTFDGTTFAFESSYVSQEPKGDCPGNISGTATVNGGTMSGSYTGVHCGHALRETFTLAR